MKYLNTDKVPKIVDMKDITYEQFMNEKKKVNIWEPHPYANYSGVYFLMNKNKVVYIGTTTKLAQNIKSHKLDKEFDHFKFLQEDDKTERQILKIIYANKYQPKYNTKVRYG